MPRSRYTRTSPLAKPLPDTVTIADALSMWEKWLAAADRPAHWVWLHHAPPAGTVLCRDGRREFPDHDLAGWIEQHQPDAVLCSHIHQAPWVDGGSWNARLGRTWVFNAGKQLGPVPAHITLDLTAGTAEWYGIFENGYVVL